MQETLVEILSRNLRTKESRRFHKVVLIYASKMPHSKFKSRAVPLDWGTAKCSCGQFFDYTSERDWDMKHRLHSGNLWQGSSN